MTPDKREQFDAMLDAIIEELPDHLHKLLEEIPLIVEDEPSEAVLQEMQIDPEESELCGLHWGVPLTHRSVEHSGTMPDRMMVFRGPIVRTVSRGGRVRLTELRRQIRITVLHEIGHHFGLDEEDLAALGYA